MNHDSNWDFVWIRKTDSQPDTCCHCGCFTDKRVSVKHIDLVPKSSKSGPSATAVILTAVLHIGLGPIGWLFSAMMDGEESENDGSLVQQKTRIKIAQCPLCHGMGPPEFAESRDGAYALRVHPKFKQGLEAIQE